MKSSITIGKRLFLGLVVAGIAAPAAQAKPLGGGYVTGAYGAPAAIALAPQTSGVGEQQVQQSGRGYTTGEYGAPRAIGLGPQASQDKQTNSTYTTGAYGAPHAIGLGPQSSGGTESKLASVASSQVTTTSGDNFDWTDAGIGAATAVGISLLLIGGVLVARRHQTRVAL